MLPGRRGCCPIRRLTPWAAGLLGIFPGRWSCGGGRRDGPTYAPELDIVGTYAGAPVADLVDLFPYVDGSALVGVVGYAINGVIHAYPESEQAIRASSRLAGEDLLYKTADQCVAETIFKFMFRHIQPYFTEDIHQMIREEPFKSLFELQRVGTFKPNAPVLINSNRYDPLVPWTAANQLGATGARRGPTWSSAPTRSRRSSTSWWSTTRCRCSSTASPRCSGSRTGSTACRRRPTAGRSRLTR